MSDARTWVFTARQTYDRDSVLQPTFAPPIINERVFAPRFDFLTRPNAVRQNSPRGRDAQGLKKSRSNTFELGDKTIKKLLSVRVPDKRDTTFINTYNQLISERYSTEEAKRITIQRLGRTQHTITKMMNIGDNKASIDETLQMIQKIKIGNKDEAINQAMNMLNRLGEGDRLTSSQWNSILSLIDSVELGADPEKNGFNKFYNFTDFKNNIWNPPQKATFMIYTARRAREEGRHPDTPYRHDRFPQKVYAKDAFLQLFQRYKDSHVLYTEQLTLITPEEAKRIDPTYPLVSNKLSELEDEREEDAIEDPSRESELSGDFPESTGQFELIDDEESDEEIDEDEDEDDEDDEPFYADKVGILGLFDAFKANIVNLIEEVDDLSDLDSEVLDRIFENVKEEYGELPVQMIDDLSDDLTELLETEDLSKDNFVQDFSDIIDKYKNSVDDYLTAEEEEGKHSTEEKTTIGHVDTLTSHLQPQSVDDVFDELEEDEHLTHDDERGLIQEARNQFGTQLDHIDTQSLEQKRALASSSDPTSRLTNDAILKTEQLYTELVKQKGAENITADDRLSILAEVNDEKEKITTSDRMKLLDIMDEIQDELDSDVVQQTRIDLEDDDLNLEEQNRVIDEAVNTIKLAESEMDLANKGLSESLVQHHSGIEAPTADDWRETMMMKQPPDPFTSLAEEQEDLTEQQIGDRVQNIFMSMLGNS